MVVVGVLCCAVLWWGSRLGSVYCMNGLMEWEGIYRYLGICILLTAGYSILLFRLPCDLFDYPL